MVRQRSTNASPGAKSNRRLWTVCVRTPPKHSIGHGCLTKRFAQAAHHPSFSFPQDTIYLIRIDQCALQDDEAARSPLSSLYAADAVLVCRVSGLKPIVGHVAHTCMAGAALGPCLFTKSVCRSIREQRRVAANPKKKSLAGTQKKTAAFSTGPCRMVPRQSTGPPRSALADSHEASWHSLASLHRAVVLQRF